MRVIWFFSAIVLSFLTVGNYVIIFVSDTKLSFIEILMPPIGIVTVLSHWGLATRRRIFVKHLWAGLLIVNLIGDISVQFILPNIDIPVIYKVIMYTQWLWYYVGLIKYAFFSKQIWNTRLPTVAPSDAYSTNTDEILNSKSSKPLFYSYGIVVVFIAVATFVGVLANNSKRLPYEWGLGYSLKPEAMNEMLEYQRRQIPEIVEYETLFPRYSCRLRPCKETFQKMDWEFAAGVYGRYLLIMKIQITPKRLDHQIREILMEGATEEPTFQLCEVTSLSLEGSESWSIKNISKKRWTSLVESNGDLSVLSVNLKKDDPTPNFERKYENNPSYK